MDALFAALSQGGIGAWLTLAIIIIVGIILLRIVFEIASTIVRVGCFALFIVVIGYLVITFFGGS